MLPTARCCCTVTRPGYGATRRIAAQRGVIRQHAPRAQDFVNRRYRHRGVVDEVQRARNRTISKVRAKVEHPIGIIKRVFGSPRCAIAGSKKMLIACS
jgi:IS5 family transposase